MLQDLENALHCLQRARKATHIQANRAFFLSKYTSYGDFNRIESMASITLYGSSRTCHAICFPLAILSSSRSLPRTRCVEHQPLQPQLRARPSRVPAAAVSSRLNSSARKPRCWTPCSRGTGAGQCLVHSDTHDRDRDRHRQYSPRAMY